MVQSFIGLGMRSEDELGEGNKLKELGKHGLSEEGG